MSAKHKTLATSAGNDINHVAVTNNWDTYNIDEKEIWIDLPGFWSWVSKFLLAALIGSLAMLVAIRAGEKPEGGTIPRVSIEYVDAAEYFMEDSK